MKRIICLLYILLTCGTFLFSQAAIDKKEYERLVDYVNSKYTLCYIESLRNNEKYANDIKQFDSEIKGKLENSTINDPISYDDWSELLTEKGWSMTNNNFSKKINEKKNGWKENANIKDIIEQIIGINQDLDESIKKPLKNIQDKLREELMAKYDSHPDESSIKPDKDSAQETQAKENESVFSLWNIIAAIVISLFLLILIALAFLYRKILRDKIGELKRELKIIENALKIEKINNVQNKNELERLCLENLELKQQNAQLSTSEKLQTTPHVIEESIVITEPSQPAPISLYASAIDEKNGKFYKVTSLPDEYTIYQLYVDPISELHAEFEVYSEATSKILGCADFLDGSNLQRIGTNEILTETKGIALKQTDGTWKISEAAKIKFI